MRRRLVLLAAVLLVAGACGGGGSSSGPQTRQVLVDYDHDEFAGAFLSYFPQVVSVRPGDTVDFKQFWTGEPHSVTMGTLVDKGLIPARKAFKEDPTLFEREETPPELKEAEQAFEVLPFMLDENNEVNQLAAQPCYLEAGELPKDPAKPCPEKTLKPFNGRQAYYNSGFIPYEGKKGNKFELKLADDIAPGTYSYYCNLHGPAMSGEIQVQPAGSKIPSQSEVSRGGRVEVEKAVQGLKAGFDAGKSGKLPESWGVPEPEGKRLSGFAPASQGVNAFGSEFVPRDIEAKVDEKVTWAFVGGHTVSFDVPRYLPIFTIAKDGTVSFNPQAHRPVGSPGPPKEERGPPGEGGPPGVKPKPPEVDAGKWDGSGFLSSGVIFEGSWSLTFTKPGNYKYACLIHPRMLGEVVVR